MPRFLLSPWRDGRELLLLRHLLYAPDHAARPRAVRLISAWKRRCSLPHAIDSTAALVDAVLNDAPCRNSALAIRNAYCAAFNRFVTGFCDTVQNGFRKMSMYDMAAELDMPGSFVELRHEATHEELPSLRRLQMATEQALQWLWDHYWSKLDSLVPGPRQEKDEPVVSEDASDGSLRPQLLRVLKSFVSGRREEIRRDGAKAGTASRLSESVAPELVSLCREADPTPPSCDTLLSLLLDERLILPSDHEIGDPMDGAYLIWDDLLRRLHMQLSLLGPLADRTVAAMARPSRTDAKSDASKAALHDWLLHMLTDDAWSTCVDPHVRDGAWTSTMTACMTQPGFWCAKAAKNLLMEGDEDFQDEWLPIFEASLPDVAPETGDGDDDDGDESGGVADVLAAASVPDEDIHDMASSVAEGGASPHGNVVGSSAFETARGGPAKARSGWRKWEGEWRPTPIGLVPA